MTIDDLKLVRGRAEDAGGDPAFLFFENAGIAGADVGDLHSLDLYGSDT